LHTNNIERVVYQSRYLGYITFEERYAKAYELLAEKIRREAIKYLGLNKNVRTI